MHSIFQEQTKVFNLYYHNDIEESLKALELTNGKLRKKALLKLVIQTYYDAYKKGLVRPRNRKVFKPTTCVKPRFFVQLELQYHEMFDEIYKCVKALDDEDIKSVKYTKTKLFEEMLIHWLEKEGIAYEGHTS